MTFHMHTHAAVDGSDYTSISMSPLTFYAGSTDGAQQCLNIGILDDDDAVEGEETFAVILATSDSDVMIDINVTVVAITDNEGKYLRKTAN